ncbi:Transcription factor ILR3 [Bienertia sinuspersici]
MTASSSKAYREKQRRNYVNTRFLDLIADLESGITTPNLDKATVLTDAIRTVKLLREETSSLTSQNRELKQKINELKAKKNDLCDEKHVLISEKEKLK